MEEDEWASRARKMSGQQGKQERFILDSRNAENWNGSEPMDDSEQQMSASQVLKKTGKYESHCIGMEKICFSGNKKEHKSFHGPPSIA